MDRTRRIRVTLDGQLVDYWTREALRFDALAAEARFGWQRRGYARRAEAARARAAGGRAREAAREATAGDGDGTQPGPRGDRTGPD